MRGAHTTPRRPSVGFADVGAAATFLAGALHIGLALTHGGSPGWAVAFGAAGAAQLAGAAAVAATRQRRLGVALAGVNLALVAAWLLARAGVVPTAHSAGFTDLAVVAAELAGAGLLAVRQASGASSGSARPRFARALPASIVAVLLGTSGVAAGAAGGSGHDHAGHPGHAAPHGTAAHDGGHGSAAHGEEANGAAGSHAGGHGNVDAPGPSASVAVGGHPTAVLAAAGSLWTVDRTSASLTRVDPVTATATATVPVGGEPVDAVAVGGTIWVVDYGRNRLVPVDARTGAAGPPVATGSRPTAATVAGTRVLVANSGDGTVTVLDTGTGRATTGERLCFGLIDVAAGDAGVHALCTLDRTVLQLDVTSLTPIGSPVPVGPGSVTITAFAGDLWVASSTAGTVSRIDPDIGDIRSLPAAIDAAGEPGLGPVATAGERGRVWAVDNRQRIVAGIDAATGQPDGARFDLPDAAVYAGRPGIVAHDGALWVADYATDHLYRFDPAVYDTARP